MAAHTARRGCKSHGSPAGALRPPEEAWALGFRRQPTSRMSGVVDDVPLVCAPRQCLLFDSELLHSAVVEIWLYK
jgi:hypothetical protein